MKVEVQIEDLTRIDARPGDVFVYRGPEHLPDAAAVAIKAHWSGVFPDHPLLVLPAGDLFAVRDEQPTVAEPVAA